MGWDFSHFVILFRFFAECPPADAEAADSTPESVFVELKLFLFKLLDESFTGLVDVELVVVSEYSKGSLNELFVSPIDGTGSPQDRTGTVSSTEIPFTRSGSGVRPPSTWSLGFTSFTLPFLHLPLPASLLLFLLGPSRVLRPSSVEYLLRCSGWLYRALRVE